MQITKANKEIETKKNVSISKSQIKLTSMRQLQSLVSYHSSVLSKKTKLPPDPPPSKEKLHWMPKINQS